MNAKLTKDLEALNFQITTESSNFSDADLALMADFTEPEVDFGGAITDGSGFTLYTLDENLKEINSELPVVVPFLRSTYDNLHTLWASGETYAVGDRISYVDGSLKYYVCIKISTENLPTDTEYWTLFGTTAEDFAETLAERYYIELQVKITAAMAALRANSNTFSGSVEMTL